MRALLGCFAPWLDASAVWARTDLDGIAPAAALERQLAAQLERHWWASRTLQLALFVACACAVWGVGPTLYWQLARGSAAGSQWAAPLVPLLAGVVVHGAFILLVHEATHGNVLGVRHDRWLGNAALGVLLLPFLAESYQHAHRVHHARVLTAEDNNWTPARDWLFRRSRLLYVLYELIPVLNNLDRLRPGQRVPRSLTQLFLAWSTAAAVLYWARPGISYYLLVLVGLNGINAARLWVEHYGFYRGRLANLYWCPFSFGIGHHDLHHRDPKLPAFALMVGLWFRRLDGNVFRAPWDVLFTPGYRHFQLQVDDEP